MPNCDKQLVNPNCWSWSISLPEMVVEATNFVSLKWVPQDGADKKGMLTYVTEKLRAANVVSSDFVKCMLEDADAKRIIRDEPVVKRETREEGFKAIASYAFKNKDFESAERYYSLMIALNHDDAVAFSNRSVCWLNMGDGGKALFDADECRKRRPDWPKACYRQGSALMLLKDYKRACERFSDGLKLDPGNAEMEDALRSESVGALAGEEQGQDARHQNGPQRQVVVRRIHFAFHLDLALIKLAEGSSCLARKDQSRGRFFSYCLRP